MINMKKAILSVLLVMVLTCCGCGESKVADDTRQIAKDAIEVMEMYQDDTMSPDEADERLTEIMMKNLREDFKYKMAIKYGLVTENIKPIKFYFEQLEEENNEK